MKTFATIALVFTAQLAAVSLSGFPLDFLTVFALATSAIIAGGCVADYGRAPARRYDAPVRRPVVVARPHRRPARPEFASVARLDTLTG